MNLIQDSSHIIPKANIMKIGKTTVQLAHIQLREHASLNKSDTKVELPPPVHFWKYADLWPCKIYKTYGGKPHTAMYGRGTKEGLQDLGDALRRKRLRSVSSSSEMKGARQSAIAADRRTSRRGNGARNVSIFDADLLRL